MTLQSLTMFESMSLPIPIASLVVVLTSIIVLYTFSKPAFPSNAPKPTTDTIPLLGSLNFFTKRWEFYKSCTTLSAKGNFSFYAGQWPVIGISGHDNRKLFFDSKQLSLRDGYRALFAGGPEVKENPLAKRHLNDPGKFHFV